MSNDHLFLNARQVAEYLDLNEKKVYAMANDRLLPGTKVTGKWLFPKSLIDRWIIDSCHGGTLSDRLIIGGSDDPLLHYVVRRVSRHIGSSGVINYSPSSTRAGLTHLANGYTDICCIHWSDSEERDLRHPALLKEHSAYKQWIMVHGFNRDFGILMRSEHHHLSQELHEMLSLRYRWIPRQVGAGARHHLDNFLAKRDMNTSDLNLCPEALSEHEMGAAIVRGEADFGMGCQGVAGEFGLMFVPLGKESFDLVMPQGVFFRQHLQHLFSTLQAANTIEHANALDGYDLNQCGKLIWSAQ